MRRLLVLTCVLVVVPATGALAADLEELLDRSRHASYTAEQVIACSTPDGPRDAVVRITQVEGELRVSSTLSEETALVAGEGDWTLTREGGLVAEASVDAGKIKSDPLYSVEELGGVEYLGRAAMAYLLVRDGEPRAEVVIDEDTGAMVQAVTLQLGGDVYCERRFVSIDDDAPELEAATVEGEQSVPPSLTAPTDLPPEVSGFDLLDRYEDEDGVRFAYYSDGFFSFAVFETATVVALPEAVDVTLPPGVYRRVFTAGQVTYVWETPTGGMALVGDLPPDLHEQVLTALPHPNPPNIFRRWWRSLFG